MRRSIAAFLLALAVSGGLAAGCGSNDATAPRPASAPAAAPPTPGDLVAAALEALEQTRSGHYALDVSVTFAGAQDTDAAAGQPLELHLAGDASDEAGTAALTLDAGGQRLTADILYRGQELFVRFLGTWYGGKLAALRKGTDDAPRELATPERVRRHFEDVFDGHVEEGPIVDGDSTWAYEGTLDAGGLRALAERYGGRLSADERAQLEELEATVALRLVVTKDDRLPRRLELDLRFGGNALTAHGVPFESLDATAVLRLSDFGKRVVVDAPERYRPLEELGQALFGGLG